MVGNPLGHVDDDVNERGNGVGVADGIGVNVYLHDKRFFSYKTTLVRDRFGYLPILHLSEEEARKNKYEQEIGHLKRNEQREIALEAVHVDVGDGSAS